MQKSKPVKQLFVLLTAMFVSSLPSLAQEQDAVLFTVADTPVPVSEFDYIYSKTNGKNADYSRKSLEEYLDLYVKFKLKVKKARDLQLDTIPALQQELEGYRRQLADAYLIDRAVTDKLTQEAYERIQQDVDISHLLVTVAADATPADTAAAYAKIMLAKSRIEKGEDFSDVAKEVSEDQSAATNGGRIGYVTALFPKGLYHLETAAYNAPLNTTVGPIRTEAGYHLLVVHQRRPARGEMEAAHILLRTKDKDPTAVKVRIDSIYLALEQGADFGDLAKRFSEDQQSAPNNGNIGFFGINRYEASFENAAFALAKDGDYSRPVQSRVGWHIIKRISNKGIQPFEVEKARLEAKVSQDPRFEVAKAALLDKIKQENDFREQRAVLDQFAAVQNDTFLTFRWKAPEPPSPAVLFTLNGDYEVSLGDFTNWLNRASRKRLRLGANGDVQAAIYELYNDFVQEKLLEFEEQQLEHRYPEFKALMREYREGILLFEATKMLVWDKASQDTLGLRKFYDSIKGKYRWGQRARTSVYRISETYRNRLPEIRAFAATNSAEEVKSKFNTEEEIVVNIEEMMIEKNRNVPPELVSANWEVGVMSQNETTRSGTIKFYKFEEILPPSTKSLQDARGYVIADYQDYLEEQWVAELEKEYPVKINRKVFEMLIKK